jgi:hypothetical protein
MLRRAHASGERGDTFSAEMLSPTCDVLVLDEMEIDFLLCPPRPALFPRRSEMLR